MAETKGAHSASTAGGADSDGEELTGRLVLATQEVVAVPAEGLSVSTHHYSEKYGVTVPVVSSFLLS
jgi:hypothetical protein